MEGIPVIDLVYDAPLNSDLVIEMKDNIPYSENDGEGLIQRIQAH